MDLDVALSFEPVAENPMLEAEKKYKVGISIFVALSRHYINLDFFFSYRFFFHSGFA